MLWRKTLVLECKVDFHMCFLASILFFKTFDYWLMIYILWITCGSSAPSAAHMRPWIESALVPLLREPCGSFTHVLRGCSTSTKSHYTDVIMGAMASQITSITIVSSTVYSGADKKKPTKAPCHWPLWGEFTGDRRIPSTNSQWRGKCFHLMTTSCSR